MQISVSVVVPVYNTEKYLKQCIDSLLNQTLRSVEFIFVDDGSTDHSVEIIEEYQRKDDRISLIKQKNQYAGVARNNGMKHARGKYIIFLDSDDFFELSLLEETYKCAEKNRAEITVFGLYEYDNQSKEIRKLAFAKALPKGVFSVKQLGENALFSIPDFVCNRLYLRSFIENKKMYFQAIRKHNDACFNHLTVAVAKRIVCVYKRYIYYRVNNPDSLQGQRGEIHDCLIDFCKELKRLLIQHNRFEGDIKRSYFLYIRAAIRYRCFTDIGEGIEADYKIIEESLIPDLFDSVKDFEEDPVFCAVYQRAGCIAVLVSLIREKDSQIEK